MFLVINAYCLTIAVVLTTCSRSGCVAVRLRTLWLVAVNPATHTPALLTHTHRIGKSLSIHKHTVFKGAVWKKIKNIQKVVCE